MQLVIIGDSHAGARNDNPFFNEFFLNFFENQFFPFLEKSEIKTVIHLGDVFDRRKYINFQTLNQWRTRVFDKFEMMGIELHIIIGNHDTYWKTTNEVNSVTELIRGYNNIKIYQEPQTVNFDDTPILMLPWINSTNLEKSQNEISNTKARICMGHLEIIGFEHFRGNVNIDKGFDRKLFDKFELVLSGHFHFKSQQDNIWYLGSPYQMVWNDYGEKHGFHVLDTRTRDLTFYKNPNEIFEKLNYDDEGETYSDLMKADFNQFQGKCIKVIVNKKLNPNLFDEFLNLLQKSNPADISIVENELQGTIEETIDEAKDTLSILIEYVDSLNLENNVRSELIEKLRLLYMDASTLERNDI